MICTVRSFSCTFRRTYARSVLLKGIFALNSINPDAICTCDSTCDEHESALISKICTKNHQNPDEFALQNRIHLPIHSHYVRSEICFHRSFSLKTVKILYSNDAVMYSNQQYAVQYTPIPQLFALNLVSAGQIRNDLLNYFRAEIKKRPTNNESTDEDI